MLGQLVHQYIHSKCSYPRQTISSLNARSGCSSCVHSKCSVRLFIYNPTPFRRSVHYIVFSVHSIVSSSIASTHLVTSFVVWRPLTRSLPLLSGVNPLRSQAYAYHVFISCRFATPSICQHAQPMDRGRGAGGRAVSDVVAQSGLVDAVCGTSPEVTWQRDRDVRSS